MVFVIDRCCRHIYLVIKKLIHREALLHQFNVFLRVQAILLHECEHLKLLTAEPGTDLLAFHLSGIGNT
ncbi:hypothetical protein D3C74_433230 [compost metagenome]